MVRDLHEEGGDGDRRVDPGGDVVRPGVADGAQLAEVRAAVSVVVPAAVPCGADPRDDGVVDEVAERVGARRELLFGEPRRPVGLPDEHLGVPRVRRGARGVAAVRVHGDVGVGAAVDGVERPGRYIADLEPLGGALPRDVGRGGLLPARAPAGDAEGVGALAHARAELHGVGDHDTRGLRRARVERHGDDLALSDGQLSEPKPEVGRAAGRVGEGRQRVAARRGVVFEEALGLVEHEGPRTEAAARGVRGLGAPVAAGDDVGGEGRGLGRLGGEGPRRARAAASLGVPVRSAVKARARALGPDAGFFVACVGVIDALRPDAVVPLAHRDDLGAGALEVGDDEVDHPLVWVDVLSEFVGDRALPAPAGAVVLHHAPVARAQGDNAPGEGGSVLGERPRRTYAFPRARRALEDDVIDAGSRGAARAGPFLVARAVGGGRRRGERVGRRRCSEGARQQGRSEGRRETHGAGCLFGIGAGAGARRVLSGSRSARRGAP